MAVHGRDGVIDVAQGLIVRGSPAAGGRRPAGPSPTLLLLGPGGVGKTAMLGEIAADLRGQPHVEFDAAKLSPSASVVDLLTALVFEFARHDDRRWRFSRFLVGRLVTEMKLDPRDATRARAEVRAELARVKDPDTLSRRVEGLLSLPFFVGLGIPVKVVDPVVRMVIAGLGTRRFGRRVVLRAGQDFYGDQGGAVRRDPTAELVILNRSKRFGGKAGAERVTKALFEAFLADVRAAARRSNSLEPVLLLDNAEYGPAPEFLRLLETARFGQAGPAVPDRLTVIATGTGVLADRLGVTDPPLDDEGVDNLRSGRDEVRGAWLPVALRGLSDAEMFELAGELAIPAEHRDRIGDLLRGLTHGHPGGTAALMRAAVGAGPGSACPDEMLAEKIPDPLDEQAPSRPAAMVIVDMMVTGLSRALRGDLVTCAAARNWTEAEQLVRSTLLRAPTAERVVLLSPAYWCHPAPGGEKAMHPLLRKLLLLELADRPADHRASWHKVFDWLVDNAEDEAASLPHRLSRGDTDEVARRMLTRLGDTDGGTWLNEVRDLVTAPAVPIGWLTTIERLSERLSPGPAAAVGRLIVAWQGVHDACAVVERADLHSIVAIELQAVAAKAHGGFARLVQESGEHQQATVKWQNYSGEITPEEHIA